MTAQEIKDMKKEVKESIADRKHIHELLRQNTKEHADISATLIKMNETLSAFNNIEINGDGIKRNFQDNMRMLYSKLSEVYSATKQIRKRKKLSEAYTEWKEASFIGKTIDTRIGKFILLLIIIFVILSVANTLGLHSVDPIGICVKIGTLLSRLV
jgi:hypothetical protein